VSTRRQKAWSPHPTPRGQVDQGRAARQAQVEAALAGTKLFSAARRLSSAADLLSGVIPQVTVPIHRGAHAMHWRRSMFFVIDKLNDEKRARFELGCTICEITFGAGGIVSEEEINLDARIDRLERELREAMAWACANVPPMEMLRFAASWPHSDWLPVSGEAQS
jgi:hypothetical protein